MLGDMGHCFVGSLEPVRHLGQLLEINELARKVRK